MDRGSQNNPIVRIRDMNKTRGGNLSTTDIPGVLSFIMKNDGGWNDFGEPSNRSPGFDVYRMQNACRKGMDNQIISKPGVFVKTGSFQRFFTSYDSARVFADSQATYGSMFRRGYIVERPGIVSQSFHIDNHNSNGQDGTTHVATSTTVYTGSRGRAVWKNSSYGTMQTMNPLLGFDIATPLRPKYYFSMTHFGHYADLKRQGLDSMFNISRKGKIPGQRNRRSIGRGRSVPPPVRVRFVTGSVDDTAGIKSYYSTNRPNSLFYVTSSFSAANSLFPSIERPVVVFTKGNVSLFSTSSFGFSEDGPMPAPTPVGTTIVGSLFVGSDELVSDYISFDYRDSILSFDP